MKVPTTKLAALVTATAILALPVVAQGGTTFDKTGIVGITADPATIAFACFALAGLLLFRRWRHR
jgi:hypothetical protein